jgi:hypothetical protein
MFSIIPAFIDVEVHNFRVLREITFGELLGTLEYALFDERTGRKFQSQPLLNTAGLGISDEGHPFRHFARPITFAPRSTLRMEITENLDFRGGAARFASWLQSAGQSEHSYSSRRAANARRKPEIRR